MTRSHAHVVLSQPHPNESQLLQKVCLWIRIELKFQKPLLSRLHQFPRPSSIDLTNLVEYPPKLVPVPVKPFFFDIAYSYIGTEKKEAKKMEPVKTKVEELKPEPAKKGWFWSR